MTVFLWSINCSSVYSVHAKGGDLWPMLAFQKSGLRNECLPLIEENLAPRPPLLTISGLLQGPALPLGTVDDNSPSWKNQAEHENNPAWKFAYSPCPLGTPSNTNTRSLRIDDIQGIPTGKNQPAWRSNTCKGKSWGECQEDAGWRKRCCAHAEFMGL